MTHKSLKMQVGRFLLLTAPVKKHGSTKQPYVDVQSNGRMFKSFRDAYRAYEMMHLDQEPVIVQIVHTLREEPAL
jgi:hypothetical protein